MSECSKSLKRTAAYQRIQPSIDNRTTLLGIGALLGLAIALRPEERPNSKEKNINFGGEGIADDNLTSDPDTKSESLPGCEISIPKDATVYIGNVYKIHKSLSFEREEKVIKISDFSKVEVYIRYPDGKLEVLPFKWGKAENGRIEVTCDPRIEKFMYGGWSYPVVRRGIVSYLMSQVVNGKMQGVIPMSAINRIANEIIEFMIAEYS